MPQEPEPPRKVYGFKTAEFEKINNPAKPGEEIHVKEMVQQAATIAPFFGNNGPVNRPNQVHAMMEHNVASANAAGLNEVKIDPHYRSNHQKRVRRFWWFVGLVDVPGVAFVIWMTRQGVNVGTALIFVSVGAGLIFFTTRLAWQTFFMNTD